MAEVGQFQTQRLVSSQSLSNKVTQNRFLDLQQWACARIADLKAQNDEKHYENIQLHPFQREFVRQQVVLEDLKINTTRHLWEMKQAGDKNEVLRSAFGDDYSTIIDKDFDSYCKVIVQDMASAEQAHAATSQEDPGVSDDEYSDTDTSTSTGEEGQVKQDEISGNHSAVQSMEFKIIVYRAHYTDHHSETLTFGPPVLTKDEQSQYVPSRFSLDLIARSALRKLKLLPVGTGEMVLGYKVRNMNIGPAKRFIHIPSRDAVTDWLQSAKSLGEQYNEIPEIEVYVYRKAMENEALKLLY